MAERHLPKVDVASSNLVSRSISNASGGPSHPTGITATQSPLLRPTGGPAKLQPPSVARAPTPWESGHSVSVTPAPRESATDSTMKGTVRTGGCSGCGGRRWSGRIGEPVALQDDEKRDPDDRCDDEGEKLDGRHMRLTHVPSNWIHTSGHILPNAPISPPRPCRPRRSPGRLHGRSRSHRTFADGRAVHARRIRIA